jgi:hypothetical protein
MFIGLPGEMLEGEVEDVLEEAMDMTRLERDPVRRCNIPPPDPVGGQQVCRIAAADLEILKGRFPHFADF